MEERWCCVTCWANQDEEVEASCKCRGCKRWFCPKHWNMHRELWSNYKVLTDIAPHRAPLTIDFERKDF